MAGINKVILMGRLTRKPSAIGNSVFFTVAVEQSYQKPGEERQADFIQCKAWNKTAEFIDKYFTKGMMIIVEGRVHSSKWEKDGETRYSQEIIANSVQFGETKKAREGITGSGTQNDMEGFGEVVGFHMEAGAEDDLPF